LRISGPPIAGNANTTITYPLALLVSDGNVVIAGTGKLGIAMQPVQPIDILTAFAGSVNPQIKNTDNGLTTATAWTVINNVNHVCNYGLSSSNYNANALIGADSGFFYTNGVRGIAFMANSAAATIRFATGGVTQTMILDAVGNLGVGVAAPSAASRLHIVATTTVASAAGAVYDGIDFAASTLTLTGATTPVTALSFFNVAGPTITAASAVVVTDFCTAKIGKATFAGAGPASATRNWSLYVEGNTRFGGGQTIARTDVNAAGPYVVLATDYFLEVRYTATGAIQITLPALTGGTQLGGRVICIKDSGYNATTNNITVAVGNGADKIENGVAGASYLINLSGVCLWLKTNTITNIWEII
jgi:hypothetical protein